MNLGMITSPTIDGLKYIQKFGLNYAEFDLNVNFDLNPFFDGINEIKEYCKENNLHIGAIGRWGSERINIDGINTEEFDTERKLIDACVDLNCPVYISNCNPVEDISFAQNITLAIEYLTKLVEYGKANNIKICTYNCNWNSLIFDENTWNLVQYHIPDLGIKYDPSHCFARGGDYLKEMSVWGDRFYHVHIKGSLYAGGIHIDDPPAGLDCTNWGAFMGILYNKGYDGMLSLEPHSPIWKNDLGEMGIKFSINHIKQFLFEA